MPKKGYKQTENHIKKRADLRLGKRHSLSTRREMSALKIGKYTGEKHPMFGKHHSVETREKMSKKTSGKNHPFYGKNLSESHCKNISLGRIGQFLGEKSPLFGKPKSENHRKNLSLANKGRISHYQSTETRAKISDANSGDKNGNWNDGASFDPYSPLFNESYKKLICENQICQICEEPGGKLVAHHWDYNKKSLNCVPVHINCNIKANGYRIWYQMAFNMKYGGQPFIMRVG